jgi:hypothetical protein
VAVCAAVGSGRSTGSLPVLLAVEGLDPDEFEVDGLVDEAAPAEFTCSGLLSVRPQAVIKRQNASAREIFFIISFTHSQGGLLKHCRFYAKWAIEVKTAFTHLWLLFVTRGACYA